MFIENGWPGTCSTPAGVGCFAWRSRYKHWMPPASFIISRRLAAFNFRFATIVIKQIFFNH